MIEKDLLGLRKSLDFSDFPKLFLQNCIMMPPREGKCNQLAKLSWKLLSSKLHKADSSIVFCKRIENGLCFEKEVIVTIVITAWIFILNKSIEIKFIWTKIAEKCLLNRRQSKFIDNNFKEKIKICSSLLIPLHQNILNIEVVW